MSRRPIQGTWPGAIVKRVDIVARALDHGHEALSTTRFLLTVTVW